MAQPRTGTSKNESSQAAPDPNAEESITIPGPEGHPDLTLAPQEQSEIATAQPEPTDAPEPIEEQVEASENEPQDGDPDGDDAPDVPEQEDSQVVPGLAEPGTAEGDRGDGYRDPETRRNRSKVKPVKADAIDFPDSAIAAIVFAMWAGGPTTRTSFASEGPDRLTATRGEGRITVSVERDRDGKAAAEARLPIIKQNVRTARHALDAYEEDGKALVTEIRSAKHTLSRTDVGDDVKAQFQHSLDLLERDKAEHDARADEYRQAHADAKAEHDAAKESVHGGEIERYEYPLSRPKGAVRIG